MILHPVDTSDVQSVNATVIGESTIDIECHFIHGSDALGCNAELISNCSNISVIHTNVSRSIMYASKQLTLTGNISCYHRVFAFDIEVNNTISNLSIEGMIKHIISDVHAGITRNACGVQGDVNSSWFAIANIIVCNSFSYLSSREAFSYYSFTLNTNHNPVHHVGSGCYNNHCYTST